MIAHIPVSVGLPASFDTNTGNHKVPAADLKSVRKVSDSNAKARVIGKTDARYWKQPRKLIKDARSPFLTCKVQCHGRRESFPLRTSNLDAAAAKAAAIFGDVSVLGWEAALEKHKPETPARQKLSTIGGLISEVQSTAGFRNVTFATYARCLRQLVAEIGGVGDQPALDEQSNPKKDRRGRIKYLSRKHGAGNKAWLAKVDSMPLSTINPAVIQKWKVAYINAAGTAPDARRRAENTASSILRNARSLFSDKALEYARDNLVLPSPMPFVGVHLPKKGSTAYKSKINAVELIEAARAELKGEAFKIFCLGLLCGLRKREIDLLTWSQVDFGKGVIRIERTEYFQPKSEDSSGEIDIDAELLALLQGWKAKASGAFVIGSTRQPKHDTSRVYYRCDPDFETLYTWLRKQGITARKPLHELRKELGAILASTQGIFAAQSVLRHAQISTTAAYYADKKKRITAGLGTLLRNA
ncbi:tyrosine recombinase XerC [Prosthecobacter sp.]|jgi:integrase|uniref:tyrosine recombinase XerC n=1 Tax=Prosthecobacter sp. TaxID=1965333 RepID=UPI0037C8C3EA